MSEIRKITESSLVKVTLNPEWSFVPGAPEPDWQNRFESGIPFRMEDELFDLDALTQPPSPVLSDAVVYNRFHADRAGIAQLGVGCDWWCEVFVNGQEIGNHHGDFTPFELDITDALREGENILAIRVLSDFGPVFGVRQRVSHTYGCQWGIDSIKGGIWQDVTLRFVPEIYISRILIDPRVPEKVLDVRAAVENRTGRQMYRMV